MARRSKKRLLGLFLVAALAWPVAAAEKRPVSFEDIMGLRDLDDAVVSPDGQRVLFTVTEWERQNGNASEASGEPGKMESVSHLFRVSAEGGDARKLTFGKKGETAPAWSPDGAWISFLAARDDGGGSGKEEEPKRQIWLLRAVGGEAFRLTDAKDGVTSYAWSPDGGTIAFTAPDPRTEEDEAKRKRRDDPVVYEGDERMTHLWTIDVRSREARRRTDGSQWTIRGNLSWAPDGSSIAFAAAPTVWLRDQREDLYLLHLEDDRVEKLTSNLGPDNAPAFSPDGRTIAYRTTPNDSEPLPDGTQTPSLRNTRLALYDRSARNSRVLSADGFDLMPGPPSWTPDGTTLLFTAGERVHREVYAYDVAAGRYRRLTTGALADLGPTSRDGSVVALTLESSQAPRDVYLSSLDFGSPRKLTTMNPEVEELALGETEVLTWKSTDGFEVEGVLLKPVGYEPGKRYPLLVVAHGGPTGAHLDSFRLRYGDGGQHWAGRGWAVLYPNPRGSTNYGEAFMRANLADWGGGDYRDIMAGVDAVIDRGIADPGKLAIQGWSYGGYMTCWTVSQTTRFKAAMIGAGLTDLVSMYGTNDVPNYLGTFFNGTLSPETEDLYRERSGLTHVDRVRTPTLILHGGSDERVPIGQPMEFFRALKDRGVPVELVFYPREGHGFSEYYHRLDRMKRQYEWITRYTLDQGESVTN